MCQKKGKDGAVPADAGAGDGDAVAVRDLFGDGKAQAAAGSVLCGMIFVEPVKDIGNILRRNAAAMVLYGHQVLAVPKGQSHGHGGAVRGKFDGIVQNRGEHLPQTPVISTEESQPRFIVKPDL